MKTGLTLEQLEKIKPPIFIKGSELISNLYLTFKEIGLDDDNHIYTSPVLELTSNPLLGSSAGRVEKDNIFYWYRGAKKPDERYDWFHISKPDDVEKIKVYEGYKYLHLFIKSIFKDYT